MSPQLLIAGAGEAADLVCRYLEEERHVELAGAIVDSAFKTEDHFRGAPILGVEDAVEAFPPSKFEVLLAVGYRGVCLGRQRLRETLTEVGYSFFSFVSDRANVHSSAVLGQGACVLPSAVVEPGVSLGDNSMVCPLTVIGHDSTIGKDSWISSGVTIGGHSRVGSRSFLGLGCALSDGTVIGARSIVGAGTLLAGQLPDDGVFLSKIASPIPYKSEEYDEHFWTT